MTATTLRPTEPADTAALVALADATGFFKSIEIVALREVLDDYHDGNSTAGHRCVTLLVDAEVGGFIYFAPAAMTVGTWYVYWIAVRPDLQGRKYGRLLLQHAEEEISSQSGRQLLIETGSIPQYEPTRQFYLRNGYAGVAVVPDYYAEGDSMVIFQKRFTP